MIKFLKRELTSPTSYNAYIGTIGCIIAAPTWTQAIGWILILESILVTIEYVRDGESES